MGLAAVVEHLDPSMVGGRAHLASAACRRGATRPPVPSESAEDTESTGCSPCRYFTVQQTACFEQTIPAHLVRPHPSSMAKTAPSAPPVGDGRHEGRQDAPEATNDTWKLAPKHRCSRMKSKSVAGKRRSSAPSGSSAATPTRSQPLARRLCERGAQARGQGHAHARRRGQARALVAVGRQGCDQPARAVLVAYAQTATRHAGGAPGPRAQGQKSGEYKPLFVRLNGKCMKLGYDQAEVFGSCMPAPRVVFIAKTPRRRPPEAARSRGGRRLRPPQASECVSRALVA